MYIIVMFKKKVWDLICAIVQIWWECENCNLSSELTGAPFGAVFCWCSQSASKFDMCNQRCSSPYVYVGCNECSFQFLLSSYQLNTICQTDFCHQLGIFCSGKCHSLELIFRPFSGFVGESQYISSLSGTNNSSKSLKSPLVPFWFPFWCSV